MVTESATQNLTSLLDYLDGLTERASVGELHERLSALEIGIQDVAEFVRFGNERYLRNLIRAGAYYHVLAICWRSGQRSPIHNHAGSTCGVRVLQGVATETIFEVSPCALIKAVESHDRRVEDVSVSQDADIHQMSNLQPSGDDLVTLHIYSPPLLRMDTYSLTDSRIGEFRPMVLEHVDGSGI